MGGCFTFVMGGMLVFGLAVALAGLFGAGCVVAAVVLGVVFACLRSKRGAGGGSFVWIAVAAVVLFLAGLPLAAFAFWVFFVPA